MRFNSIFSCVFSVVTILTLSAGCASITGGNQANPLIFFSIPVNEVRMLSLSGTSAEPEIAVINSSAELNELVYNPSELDTEIDFSSHTVIYVSWYLPDGCTQHELIALQGYKSGEVDVKYATQRNSTLFCSTAIRPFEQVLVIDSDFVSAQLILDNEILANSASH